MESVTGRRQDASSRTTVLGGRLRRLANLRDLYDGVAYAHRVLREPLASDGGAADVRRRVANRAAAFLSSVELSVFAYDGSPYRPLLEQAHIDLPRLKALVDDRGLEGA